ncbi:integral membrane protein [Nannizzia gypsea CBS 118893]|uniref:Integral membrane protein n=1 Tax=Arthroderma gypseum (strain ATCC MYA-4604 / CBS 118893) TaxID=535722 RepID=E4UXD9_ARTGP|nr:integral membrane protein [Nannizzia gypsea CBS 118893]EFR01887.1 integral membrane protein [Nannizzia gypsea CBS 118893]
MNWIMELFAMAREEHTTLLANRGLGNLSPEQTQALERFNFPLLRIHYRYFPPVVTIAFMSLIATVCSFLIITYRLVFWRRFSATYLGYNQYVILIYNLIIADMQTAGGAIMTLHWYRVGHIAGSSSTCIIQGWLFQEGIPTSGLFVLAIAIHTFITVVLGRKLKYRTFVCCVIGIWVFALFITVLPMLVAGKHAYANSGAWCWITANREDLRLGTHYIWVFISQFGSVTIYIILFFYLRQKVAVSASLTQRSQEKLSRLRRVVRLMILYPIAYVFLSLPIAASRMATAAGAKPSFTYYIISAMIMSASGLIHTIIYAVTRRSLILNSEATTQHKGGYGPSSANQDSNSPRDIENTACTTLVSSEPISPSSPVSMYKRMYSRINGTSSPAPGEQQYEMNGVYQQTTISVTTTTLPPTRGGLPPTRGGKEDTSSVGTGDSPRSPYGP